MSLFGFIFNNYLNRKYLSIALICVIIQFIIFKILYPFPDFFSDSYSYIYAASSNLDVSIWPIGYSKFLRWFHSITHSDTALVATQYALMQISGVYLFFTLRLFYNLGKSTSLVSFIFLFFNPLSFYLSNYINSDSLFAALSLCWFTHLLWIINRPHWRQIPIQACLVFLAFTVRNNAYYYPLITALSFILSAQRPTFKLTGAMLPLTLIIPFILFTKSAAKKLTGTAQYSLFTGWQIANNTLYMYGRIAIDSNIFTTPQTKELNRLCAGYFSPMGNDYYRYLNDFPANFFIVHQDAPLKKYFLSHYDNSTMRKNAISWGRASVVFEAFGKPLLKKHPIAYARYFMLPNVKNYFFPKLEKMGVYNLGQDYVSPLTVVWFDYNSSRVTVVSRHLQGLLLLINPIIFMLANIYLLVGLGYYFHKYKQNGRWTNQDSSMLLVATFWLLNFVFNIFATVIIFRYHAFPFTVIFCFSLLLLEILKKHASASGSRFSTRKRKNREAMASVITSNQQV